MVTDELAAGWAFVKYVTHFNAGFILVLEAG
jgi:hypothetical protein